MLVYKFGPHPIPGSHVFALTELSYGFVNLKPVVPGQTVPHVHVHVLPRRAGDFPKNDEVYDAIDRESVQYDKAAAAREPPAVGTDAAAPTAAGEKLDLDRERVVRTHAEMAEEAAALRALLAAAAVEDGK
ncbi:hypothetical protein GPECTOR_24g279 [Gonium pectorale]|uniref:HIT domain-containing protein n=1 Tax=Gonium pectorale TaxID=33097 RepID=A0A150GGP9_GONPE|nr:hypothetical protein GPECTOR_24g279 [Gonium pectorale]|eukprot:KXZ48989.1 hypothetical protein GPECTOR_24g279 [Gonium pectorale]